LINYKHLHLQKVTLDNSSAVDSTGMTAFMNEKVRLVMVWQCNNIMIKASGASPDNDAVSWNGCRTGLDSTVDNLHLMCQDLLYIWQPGTMPEVPAEQKAIKANPVGILHLISLP